MSTDAQWALVQVLDGVPRHDLPNQLGLAENELDRIWAAYESARAALAAPQGEGDDGLPPRVGHILRLAEIIREVDGSHSLGASALAEAILSHPGSRWGRPTPQPIPVSELPGPEDCIRRRDGYWCWGQERSLLTGLAAPRWRLMRVDSLYDEAVSWLPAHALPLPTTTETTDE